MRLPYFMWILRIPFISASNTRHLSDITSMQCNSKNAQYILNFTIVWDDGNLQSTEQHKLA